MDELDFAQRLKSWSTSGFKELGDTDCYYNSNTISRVKFLCFTVTLSRAREAGSPSKAAARAWTRDTHCPLIAR